MHVQVLDAVPALGRVGADEVDTDLAVGRCLDAAMLSNRRDSRSETMGTRRRRRRGSRGIISASPDSEVARP